LLLLGAVLVGCNGSPAAPEPPAQKAEPNAEEVVRARFKELQTAVHAKDADKVWGMLCKKAKAEAEQAAAEYRADHDQAGPKEKAAHEKALGLSGADIAKLTGPGMLKTKRFLRKYQELYESVVEKVTVQGDTATVYWVEPDEDHEKTIFLREDGRWQAWLWVPKFKK
jgi:hypothetical protein